MDPKVIRFLSLVGIISVMALSGVYFYTTWQSGEPRWYFFILMCAIALLLVYNIIGIRRKR